MYPFLYCRSVCIAGMCFEFQLIQKQKLLEYQGGKARTAFDFCFPCSERIIFLAYEYTVYF